MTSTPQTKHTYHTPKGGLPPQTNLLTDRAVFTEAYAVIPGETMTDIVTSALPFWAHSRAWILARPLSGFAETFSHYLMDVQPGGGSDRPDTDTGVETALFVVGGTATLTVNGDTHLLMPGGYAYIPPGALWTLWNLHSSNLQFHFIRKRYAAVDGLDTPPVLVASDDAVAPTPMPDTDGAWSTTRFVDPADMRHDMHITIVTLQPGACIPFPETHVMEHGLFVLQGKGVYKLNRDWVEVEAGDFMWLRAFCPQACTAGGPEPFRYLLYKDVNRHVGV
ncbi:MAG: bifunctional allantoicase/(S)-ureidoglycine aminohydrolase [Pseudomonadota bacterium]